MSYLQIESASSRDMGSAMKGYEENLLHLQRKVQSGLDKLKAGIKDGPDGVVTLTKDEGMLFYCLLTEHLGIQHRGKEPRC